MSNEAEVGANIRDLREGLGMTQADLANELSDRGIPGFWPQTVVKVENGRRKVSFVEGMAMADALGVEPEVLLTAEVEAVDGDRRAMRALRVLLDRRMTIIRTFQEMRQIVADIDAILANSELSEGGRIAAESGVRSHGPAELVDALVAIDAGPPPAAASNWA